MATRPDLSSGWESFEVFERDGSGQYAKTPFSEALRQSGKLPTQAITKMLLVQDRGLFQAQRDLRDDLGRPLIVKKDDLIWLLKCKPTCWRLYFYADQKGENKRIVYVSAVCKKTGKENPSEVNKARRTCDKIGPGGSGIKRFEFPSDARV